MPIIDRKNLCKNTAKLTRWMDKNLFGVTYPKKKTDIYGDLIDKWFGDDDE